MEDAVHYSRNVAAVSHFLIRETRPGAATEDNWYELMERCKSDFEKLLGDIRSYLDPLYKFVQLLPKHMAIPVRKEKSFGKFCDWVETENIAIDGPLTLMYEVAGWAQTIRRIRDNIVHHAHDPIIFVSDRAFGISLNRHGTDATRKFPDAFYVPDNANNLLQFPTFIAWAVAPVYALDFSIGEWLSAYYFDEEFSHASGKFGQSFTCGPFVESLETLLIEQSLALRGEYFDAQLRRESRPGAPASVA